MYTSNLIGKLLSHTRQDLLFPSELTQCGSGNICQGDFAPYWRNSLLGGCSGFVNHTSKDANLPAVPTPHPQRSSIRSRSGGYGGHLGHRELITFFKMTGALCHGVMRCCLHPQLNKLSVDAEPCAHARGQCTNVKYPYYTLNYYVLFWKGVSFLIIM